jgi:acyl CoA:acetate/3-ketoacid CoA transferase
MNSVTPVIRNKVMSAVDAAGLIKNGNTVVITGAGGGMLEPDSALAGLEERFLRSGSPRDLTVVYSLGFGDRDRRGTNRFAHEGLIRRVIGGHFGWSSRLRALIQENKVEAYALPSGVITHLVREIGAGRPGLFTHIGLGTFVDPRQEGGRMNACAKDALNEVINIGGKEYLHYKPFKVDVAFVRGTMADPDGNISLDQEIANLDVFTLALAAHNCGGKVIVQVRTLVERGALPARSVRIPGLLVDAIIVDPDQMQNYETRYDPGISGEKRVVVTTKPQPFSVRKVVARRAADELFPGAALNFGFGMPDGIPKLLTERGEQDLYSLTVEHGVHGGNVLDGWVFGTTVNATAMIDSPSQFDFYSGGGLDIAFLGLGELDENGNVNVSFLNEIVGPGGFIDITQRAKKVVFCGTFDAKGTKLEMGDGRLKIVKHGDIGKLVKKVAQVTFSGGRAIENKQEVVYVTERAVFKLMPAGVELVEVAPGVDIKGDILDRMGFQPVVRNVQLMNAAHFNE